jgi:outer membrane protein
MNMRLYVNKRIQAIGRILLSGIVFFFITGCALPPPIDPYAPISNRTDSSVVHQPQASPPVGGQAPFTIERALETALNHNPEIAAITWEVSIADSKLEATQAGRFPTFIIEAGYQRFLDDQRLIAARYNGEPGVFDKDISRIDLVLKLPIFTGGRITHEIIAADLLKQSEEKRLARSREELIFNVSSLFYGILGQHEVIRSIEFSIGAMEEHFKQVTSLLGAQKAAKVDLLRTEVRLSDLRQSLVKAKNGLSMQKRLLANLLGLDPDMGVISVKGELSFEKQPDTPTKDLFSIAMKQRADYLSAKNRLEAQARRVDAARAGYWPTVSITGSYGFRIAGTDENEDASAIGMGASIPLFDGGRTSAQIRQEIAGLRAAQERLHKLELQIHQEVETAALDIQSSVERVHATQLSIDQAGETLRIERMKYDLGSGSITEVLDAQAALLQSETNHTQALADFHIATARLTLATGGKEQ